MQINKKKLLIKLGLFLGLGTIPIFVSSCSIIIPDSIPLKSNVSLITNDISKLANNYIDNQHEIIESVDKNKKINLTNEMIQKAKFYAEYVGRLRFIQKLKNEIEKWKVSTNEIIKTITDADISSLYDFNDNNLTIYTKTFYFRDPKIVNTNKNDYFISKKPIQTITMENLLDMGLTWTIIYKDQTKTHIKPTDFMTKNFIDYKKLENKIDTRLKILYDMIVKNESLNINHSEYESLLVNNDWKKYHENVINIFIHQRYNEGIKIDIDFLSHFLLKETLK
ncbi:hypothetical protein [Ureaplasma urealyticum]|uniref:Lipoprotein n=2 Tax=Ureaplasma urealyticum TaxID=2130 RepID=A0AAP9AD17_UREUR|nr:hypothetical protein [Ureaplasma urealyticum]EDX53967.1 putative lipoprotein [Ureaplasma urealyticum serovar 9 str. ATCC 33175]EDT49503.1 putative lipoprotein [Ureaplasma urealyticum serovar 13 str. ATCC 33698]EDU06073.1 putative lipoprotein [Ureaplasma urealyticum serovar 5 str. ATCC 27817]EDU56820.1 putative lipoprotein [Ureaplasma urealyticum serovar 7 str. ATCC 27819]EDU66839.1 putative lipoprotein [Ureaplasma urealyticum serovar 11 str. ATCC 33695]